MFESFIVARISCADGDWKAIAKHLLRDSQIKLRRFLLGETENVRFHIHSNGHEVVHVLYLSQKRWHKLARLLTGRASFFRRHLQRQNGHGEQSLHVHEDSDKKVLIDIEPKLTSNVEVRCCALLRSPA
jgi:hypothetical protein